MIFDFQENKCVFEVLKILVEKEKSKYGEMFKKTKVSHVTLQTVLRKLAEKEFISKHNIGHQKVDYTITNKGKKLLNILFQLREISA